MPPPPIPPQPPSSEDPSGTRLESDEEVRRALQKIQAGQPSAVKTTASAPKSAPSIAASAGLYRPTLRPPIALLTVLDDGKSEGEVLRLRTDHFVIGRTEGDFLLPLDQLISSRHLDISRQRVGDRYRWVLTDLQSTNGLYIRVSRTVLVGNAEFLVGMGRYRFEAPGGALANTVDYLPEDGQHGSTRPLGTDAAALLHPALLEVVGEKILSRQALTKPECWIGSDPACSVCRAGDPFVEPRHVRLYREAKGAWHAQNNKTLNGLWFRVPQMTVADTCLFQIGEQRFRLTMAG